MLSFIIPRYNIYIKDKESKNNGKNCAIIIALQKTGCHNINLVTPTHLVPQILKFLKEKVFSYTHVNIMSQYRPMGDVFKIEELSRGVTVKEFKQALRMAENLKLQVIQ